MTAEVGGEVLREAPARGWLRSGRFGERPRHTSTPLIVHSILIKEPLVEVHGGDHLRDRIELKGEVRVDLEDSSNISHRDGFAPCGAEGQEASETRERGSSVGLAQGWF